MMITTLKQTVLRLERLGGRQIGIAIALTPRSGLAGPEEVSDRIGQEPERRSQEIHVEVLALPRPEAMDERCVDRSERVEGRGQIGDRATDLGGWMSRHAGERH